MKSSPAHLPFREPWFNVLNSHWRAQTISIPIIASRRSASDQPSSPSNFHDDEGTSRHTFFLLHCPKCNAAKDAHKCTLYTTHATVVACRQCSVASASSKWRCIHNVPWLRCPCCRSVGFKCKRKAKLQRVTSQRRAHMTSIRMMRKGSKLGGLGLEVMLHNSASGGNLHNKKIKKTIKKMIYTNPKGECSPHSWPSIYSSSSSRSESCYTTGKAKPSSDTSASCIAVGEHCVSACGPGANEASVNHQVGIIEQQSSNSTVDTRFDEGAASDVSSKRRRRCLSSIPGSCPTVFTLDRYCEACHG